MPTLRTASLALALGASLSTLAGAQTSATTSLLTTVGKDTLCFEQYSRTGNVVTGSWIVMHTPGVYVHDYRITLGADGVPVHYEMKYSEPLSANPPDFGSVTIDYTRDTATYTMHMRDSSITQKFAMHEPFPFLGQSWVGLDLALQRLRHAHIDSATIVANAPSQLQTPPSHLAIHFVGDSATVGQALHARVAPDGTLLGLAGGPLTVQRVASLDIPQLTKHFVDAFAPKMAALNAASAARVEISLPASQLDKFVGDYSVPQATLSIVRDGDHLQISLPGQPKITLLAMSQTEFFVRTPAIVVSFDVDAHGAVTGLTLAQGEVKQKLTRAK